MNISSAAQQQLYNPWSLPDDITMFHFAPEYIRSFMHPHWHTQKAVHPVWYYALGLYFLFIGSTAFFGNLCVLRIFGRCNSLRTPSNMLVMNLAFSDLMLMVSLMPELLYNFFTGGPWRFGDLGCQIHAFCGAFFGYSQITTLTMISWDRYNVIVNGMGGSPLTFSTVVYLIIFNWIWSFGWAVCPLAGWGLYSMDGMMGTCSFDPLTKSMSNKTHMLATTVAFYGLPILIIAGCYFFIVRAVYKHEDEMRQQARKMNVSSLRNNCEMEIASAEIRIAKIALINISLWFLAWTPFTVVCMFGTWGGDQSWITPLVSELPVLLAKTSCAYNPVVYALSHQRYREQLKELHPWICIVLEKNNENNGDAKSVGTLHTETFSSGSDDLNNTSTFQ